MLCSSHISRELTPGTNRILNTMAKKLTLAIYFLFIQSASAQQYDNALITEEIEKFYSEYVTAFTTQQIDQLADNYMIGPLYVRYDLGTVLLQNKEAVISHMNSVYSELSKQSYARSEILATNICVLNDTSVLVSVGFRRFDSSENVILESGATYSIIKIDGKWRLAMMSVHDAKNIISCGN